MWQRKHFLSMRLVRVAGIAGFCATIAMSPATAQLPPAPGATGGTPPCDVNAAAAQARAQAFPCGVIITGAGLSTRDVSSRARGAGAQIRFEYRLTNAVAATVSNHSILSDLSRAGLMLIPDRRVTAIAKPDKGGGGSGPPPQVVPEGVKRIGADGLTNTGIGVGVAIVDTGLDFKHADLMPVEGPCFDAFGGDCQDQNGHGTHVGGIVAARNNTIDVVGVAPGVALYSVRVLDASGSGSDSTVMAGLDWIGDNTALIQVANMSLGRPGDANDNPALRDMVGALRDQGVTIVVSAGNSATSTTSEQVPAAYADVLPIASTTAIDGASSCNRVSGSIKADTASYFTTDGGGVTVSAPGEDKENVSRGCFISSSGILSLKRGGGTTRMSGTSMAAPHVAGVAALLIAAGVTSPSAVKTRLQCSADRKGEAPLDAPTTSYSFDGTREGIVSASRALAGTGCP